MIIIPNFFHFFQKIKGVPDGTLIPNEKDCNKFTLCDGGFKLDLYCRSAAPYFDKCTKKCVEDKEVCTKTSCDGVSDLNKFNLTNENILNFL